MKDKLEEQFNPAENAIIYVTYDTKLSVEEYNKANNTNYVYSKRFLRRVRNISDSEFLDTSSNFNQDVFKYKFIVRTIDDNGNFFKEGVQLTNCATGEITYYPDFETYMDTFELDGKMVYGGYDDENVLQNVIIIPIFNQYTYCHTIYERLNRGITRDGWADPMYHKGTGSYLFNKYDEPLYCEDGDVIYYKGKSYVIASKELIETEYLYDEVEIEHADGNNFLVYENYDLESEQLRLNEKAYHPKAGYPTAWKMLTEFKFDDGTTLLDNFHILKFISYSDIGFETEKIYRWEDRDDINSNS